MANRVDATPTNHAGVLRMLSGCRQGIQGIISRDARGLRQFCFCRKHPGEQEQNNNLLIIFH